MKNELYKNHFYDIFSAKSIDKIEYSNQKIDFILERLISCLPNEGKLYKYRLIEGQSFNRTYDCLKEKYIWLSKPVDLNDDDDTTLNIDLERDLDYLLKEINDNPEKFFDFLINLIIKNEKDKENILDNKEIFLNYLDFEHNELNDEEVLDHFLSLGYRYFQCKDKLVEYKVFINNLKKELEQFALESVDKLVKISQEVRQKAYVYSMSDSYDIDEMWGHYSNNIGFCIEYDFNKLKNMDYNIKRKLIHTFKINYVDKPHFSLVPMFEYAVNKNETLLIEQNIKANTQILSKKPGWSSEREWRVLLEGLEENKLYVDFVSSIIIDERSIDSDNAKKLIELSRDNGWKIVVRKRNIYNKHYYENINNI